MIKIDKSIVERVTWEQDPDTFDQRLHALGNLHDEFIVVNPKYEWILDYIDTETLTSSKCIVWAIDNLWLVKKFKSTWTTSQGWELIHCKLELEQTIEYNPEVNFTNYDLDYKINIEDANVEHVWYLDSEFVPVEDRVWAVKIRSTDSEIQGTKDMGHVTPKVEYIHTDIIYNTDIPVESFVGLEIPQGAVNYDLVWYLDPKFNPFEDKIWAARITASFTNSLGSKDMGYITPDLNIQRNPAIPDINLTYKNSIIPYYELKNDLVWYLDRRFNPIDEEVWALKILSSQPEPGYQEMGYAEPEFIFNPDIPTHLDYFINDEIPYFDLGYEHVWMLDSKLHTDNEQIWAAKIVPNSESLGTKIVGNIGVVSKDFDVVFISYYEPNAEANWYRLLEICPTAKRVKNVKGIFEAHKQAAELATTEMFYVVDGDAELVDNWKFDFRPNVFDMDCVHLWTSVNPVNDLEYGYGGVKLFPRQLLLDAKTWNVDLTTGLGKLKYITKVSNSTTFNTDPFGTWRSAFRECAKLSSSLYQDDAANLTETEKRLRAWTTLGEDRQFGEYALHGARLGKKYGEDNSNNPLALKLINNYEWMKNEFDKFYKH
jgi:hypothetical protein